MSYDVSVVVPMYNAEKFIRSCVGSALNQTMKNIEVIIIDDCSTDNSLNLCRELYGSNDRVKIFQQPVNHGPGAARNAGIREASGEYIAFLDSDDEMLPENLQKMYTAAKEHDADVLHNDCLRIMLPLEDGKIPAEMLDYPDNIIISRMDVGEARTEIQKLSDNLADRFDLWIKGSLHIHVGNKMFRRSFVVDNGLSFPEAKFPEGTMLSEDDIFCLQCILTAKNYVLMPGGWYVIRFNDTSATRIAKTVVKIINAVHSQLEVVKCLRAMGERIPFMKDEANFTKAADTILRRTEDFAVRLNYQNVCQEAAGQGSGSEALRTYEKFSTLFREEFGDKAPYVEFLFFQLHDTYPELPKLFVLNHEAMEAVKRAFKEAQAAGKEFIIERK